jgi:PAS domain-containing protein
LSVNSPTSASRSCRGFRSLRLPRSWRRRRRPWPSAGGVNALSIDNLAASAQAIVDGLPDPLISVDRQRRIVRTNLAAASLLGTVGAERDLSTVLRQPQLLAAIDALLETGRRR